MSAPKDGGPAFPQNATVEASPGMSLRDWFAGQALAGLCAAHNERGVWTTASSPSTADFAYTLADAMLAEREKP